VSSRRSDAELQQELDGIVAAGLQRRLRERTSAPGPRVHLGGREVINVSSNDYLGYASDERLRRAAANAAVESGTGSAGSRLIIGNASVHEQLERELAIFHRAEAAVLFNSGYHANVGVVSAVVGSGDVVFSDALNHASIIDGCRMSRAEVVVCPHRDYSALAGLIAQHGAGARRRLVVTDAVFSMDGDRAALDELAQLCTATESWLMVDEAHALGVVGPHGAGLSSELGCADGVDVRIGTLGKAVGSFGGYAVGSSALGELLLHRARSFVFTTALPPAVIAASACGLGLMAGADGDDRRVRLWQSIRRFAAGLRRLGLEAVDESSAIFPIVIGDARKTMGACEALLELGVYAQGIRPPTVPCGTSRLRIALMATHTSNDIDAVLAALGELRRQDLLA